MPHLLLSGGVGSSGWTLADDQTLTTSAGNMVCLVKLIKFLILLKFPYFLILQVPLPLS